MNQEDSKRTLGKFTAMLKAAGNDNNIVCLRANNGQGKRAFYIVEIDDEVMKEITERSEKAEPGDAPFDLNRAGIHIIASGEGEPTKEVWEAIQREYGATQKDRGIS